MCVDQSLCSVSSAMVGRSVVEDRSRLALQFDGEKDMWPPLPQVTDLKVVQEVSRDRA